MSADNPPAQTEMRDHWWWRPGWSLGRSFYTWHITFADQPAIHPLADVYTPVLASLPTLDLIPVQWLHLTVQGLGFTDEISQADVDAIVQSAEHRLTELRPFTITIGPPHVDSETIQMPVQPAEPLRRLRAAIREAIANVWGSDHVPELAEGWRPHVSLAYSNAAGLMEPIAEALAAQPEKTAEVEIAAVVLIDLNRDNRAYEWSDVAVVGLGG